MVTDRPLGTVTGMFVAGILAAAFAMPLVWSGAVLLLGLAGLYAFTRRTVWGLGALLIAFALLGAIRYQMACLVAPNDVSRIAPATVTLTGVVESDVEIALPQDSIPHAARFEMRAYSATTGSADPASAPHSLSVSGTIAVHVPLSSRPVRTARDRSFDEMDWNGSGSQKDDRNAPRYGDRITVHGVLERPSGPRNPGAFDERAYLAQKGIYATLFARRPEDWHIVSGEGRFVPGGERTLPAQEQSGGGHPLLRLAFALRQGVLRHSRMALSPPRAGVLNGILLGDRSDLPAALRDDFERTGTVHVLATAGLHVGMVIGLLLGFLRLCRVAYRPALAVTLLALLLFVEMAGGRPSVSRAVIMASIYLFGLLLEREPDMPNALALAALILLAGNPRSLFDPGFQLSFATVITIVMLMPILLTPFAADRLQRFPPRAQDASVIRRTGRTVLEGIAACCLLAVAAQVGAAPLIAYYSHELSLVSILANTLAVPLIALVLALGFSAAALGALTPLLSLPLDLALNGLLAALIAAVHTCAALPYACLSVSSPPVSLLIAYYAALWTVAWRWQRRTRPVSGAEPA